MISVIQNPDDATVASLLCRSPEWSAYALCDLDPPYRAHARYRAAVDAGVTAAVLLIYDLDGFQTLLPFGAPEGVKALLARSTDPPTQALWLAEHALVPALETRYDIQEQTLMSRMCARARQVAAPPSTLPLRRLERRDVPDIRELYALWGDTPFEAEMLEHGVYIGAWDGARLAAVAGTHAVSRTRRIAAIGGVFTHPDYRRRGLAAATTGEVCRSLADLDIDMIALNVRHDNSSAIGAYCRIGFTHTLPYLEGRAQRRD